MMASLDSVDMNQRLKSTRLTREDIMLLAQNEYARQLCKFTKAQLKKNVPCYTEQQQIGKQALSSARASSHQ